MHLRLRDSLVIENMASKFSRVGRWMAFAIEHAIFNDVRFDIFMCCWQHGFIDAYDAFDSTGVAIWRSCHAAVWCA